VRGVRYGEKEGPGHAKAEWLRGLGEREVGRGVKKNHSMGEKTAWCIRKGEGKQLA